MQVRFLYHFGGSKVTNSRQNPEWYLTQVLKWIGAHEPFVDSRIQPVLSKNNVTSMTAKVSLTDEKLYLTLLIEIYL